MKQLAVGMIWLLQALNLQAQDTVLSKETRVVQVTNSYLKHQVHSRHLRTTRPPDDTTFSSLDPEVVEVDVDPRVQVHA